MTKTCIPYWEEHGFKVDGVVQIANHPEQFHPIYSIAAASAQEGLNELEDLGLDAIVMLGTGMPTLEPILERPQVGGAPVMSCMLCLGWASIDAVRGRQARRRLRCMPSSAARAGASGCARAAWRCSGYFGGLAKISRTRCTVAGGVW